MSFLFTPPGRVWKTVIDDNSGPFAVGVGFQKLASYFFPANYFKNGDCLLMKQTVFCNDVLAGMQAGRYRFGVNNSAADLALDDVCPLITLNNDWQACAREVKLGFNGLEFKFDGMSASQTAYFDTQGYATGNEVAPVNLAVGNYLSVWGNPNGDTLQMFNFRLELLR